jgi:hypothetical protein
MGRATNLRLSSARVLVSVLVSACGASAPKVVAPQAGTSGRSTPTPTPTPAEPAASASANPCSAAPTEAECKDGCAAELASSRNEIATQIGDLLNACPSEADNARADCLDAANAQLASANEQVDAAFAACNDACASSAAAESGR